MFRSSSGETSTGVSSTGGPVAEGVGVAPCLLCSTCRNPVCPEECLLVDVTSTLSSSVFTYRLDLLTLADVPLYSATNPSGHRFDVVRCTPRVVTDGFVRVGRTSFAEHSWFPPRHWSMADCASCGSHLGWAFNEPRPDADERDSPRSAETEQGMHHSQNTPNGEAEQCEAIEDDPESSGVSLPSGCNEETPSAAPRALSFVGLIVTRCAPVDEYTAAALLEARQTAAARAARNNDFERDVQRFMALLRRMENRLLANQLAAVLLYLDYPHRDYFSGALRRAEQEIARQAQRGEGGAPFPAVVEMPTAAWFVEDLIGARNFPPSSPESGYTTEAGELSDPEGPSRE